MSVIIGSARIDERGKVSGGKAGDQKNGAEVSTQSFYVHSKGWVILRAKEITVREKIARNMQWACDSNNLGYDQSQRNTLYNLVKSNGFSCEHINKAVECDCSSLVRVCVNYAGIPVGDFNTASESSVLMATGKFDKIAFNSESQLLRGDILVTKTKGHSVVVLTNGVSSTSTTSTTSTTNTQLPTLRRGSKGAYVGKLQQALLNKNFKTCVINGQKKYLTVDNDFGAITESILKRYQGYVGLTADGICGTKTWAKLC